MIEPFIPEIWAPELIRQFRSVVSWDRFYTTRRKTWRERLFSWPWRPWHRWTREERKPTGGQDDQVRVRVRVGKSRACQLDILAGLIAGGDNERGRGEE